MNVFVDTNVLIDVVYKRHPFYNDSFSVWSLAENKEINGLVSAVSLPNVFYLVKKQSGRKEAYEAMRTIRDSFTILQLDAELIRQAIDGGFSDFEDALQYFTALRAGAMCIVTRNPKHFPLHEIPILTPQHFLSEHFPS
ncbi:PIN domain-containing protein [bacterium]|nr:PIN domain-containing protein [bacterium]